MDQRLGQYGFRRFLRFVLFWQVADGRSAAVHQEISFLQDGQSTGARFDFPRLRGPQCSSGAKLVVLSRAGVLRKDSEVRGIPGRTAWPAETYASSPQGRRRSGVVRKILLQNRQTRKRGGKKRLTVGSGNSTTQGSGFAGDVWDEGPHQRWRPSTRS